MRMNCELSWRRSELNALDWGIVAGYLAGMIGLALWLSRTQKTGNDYLLGGNRVGHWAIAVSILATQCSTNSLLGARLLSWPLAAWTQAT